MKTQRDGWEDVLGNTSPVFGKKEQPDQEKVKYMLIFLLISVLWVEEFIIAATVSFEILAVQ